MHSNGRFPLPARREFAIGSVALFAVMLSFLMVSPDAVACAPYVVGDAQCPDGDPAEGVAVFIERSATTSFPPCDPGTYSATTDEVGHFYACVHCPYTWVDITIDGETRTQFITGYTDFGVWTVNPDADEDGWSLCDGDCDDNNPDIHPGHVEVCDNQIDDDCDGLVDEFCGGGSPIFRKPNIHEQPTPERP